MFDIDFSALDADATLATATQARAVAERAEVAVLRCAAQWADLHGHLQDTEGGVALPGCERLVQLGGTGTPEVAEFAPAELGAVLEVSTYAADRLVGDVLDLRHRLPTLWGRVQAGEVKPWIARRTAEATRPLSVETAAVVDRRVTRWAHSLSWGRLAAIIDATVIDADPVAAAEAVAAAEVSQGVWLSPSSDHGIKDIHIRTQAPAAIWFDATIDRVAASLALLGDESSKDTRRAAAVGVLAQPQQVLDLFDQVADAAGVVLETSRKRSDRRVDTRPPVTLYVHLSQDALASAVGVARVEGVGPVTADRVKTWLRHAHVTVKPVIDLNTQIPVDAYEIPDRLREAVHLRSPVDAFPYAASTRRTGDIDHTIPYRDPDTGGPPRQTSLANLGPMTRFHHRIKTLAGWQVDKCSMGPSSGEVPTATTSSSTTPEPTGHTTPHQQTLPGASSFWRRRAASPHARSRRDHQPCADAHSLIARLSV